MGVPGWEYRVKNPGCNNTKSAFADSAAAPACCPWRRAFGTLGGHGGFVARANLVEQSAKHRVKNPGYNNTKSAFADSAAAPVRCPWRRAFGTNVGHGGVVALAILV